MRAWLNSWQHKPAVAFFVVLGVIGFSICLYFVHGNLLLSLLSWAFWAWLWPWVAAVAWTLFDFATGRIGVGGRDWEASDEKEAALFWRQRQQ